MEAKDFIIGGWYYHKEKNLDGSPRICAEKVDLGIIKCILDYTNEYFEAKDYNPIPISEDILEANGFRNVIGYSLYSTDKLRQEGVVVKISDEMLVSTWQDHNDNNYVELSCGYVHELQRVLRCCGLNEIADNFKI